METWFDKRRRLKSTQVFRETTASNEKERGEPCK